MSDLLGHVKLDGEDELCVGVSTAIAPSYASTFQNNKYALTVFVIQYFATSIVRPNHFTKYVLTIL